MIAALALTSAATAQVTTNGDLPDLNAQTFRPTIDGARTLVVDDATMPETGGSFRVLLSYHDDLLVYTPDGGDTQQKLVANVFQTDIIGGVGIGPVRLGIDIPVYLYANGDATPEESGLGDIALDGRITIFGTDAPVDAPIDVGIQGRLAVPSASVDAPLGDPGPLWRIALVGSAEIGRTLLAANLGTMGRPASALENGTINDAFEYRLGGGYALSDTAGLSLELAGVLHYGVSNRVGQPLEALVGGYWEPATDWHVRAGLGRGITSGIGSPDVRAILGLSYAPSSDSDRRVRSADTARGKVDTDGDSIADGKDRCPDEPEDVDGYLDDDGCPELTPLAIRVVDEEGSPLRSSTVTLTSPADETQTFRRGKANTNAGPGSWTIAAEADTYLPATQQVDVVNGPAQEVVVELQPDPEARVVLRGGRIDLQETVQFQTSSATLLRASRGLLDEVARIMSEHPEIEKVSVEGHTDSRGNDAFNLDLSKRRAASVVSYLVGKGIDASRLSSEGYGETRPLDPAENAAAWTKNRRVELKVVQWGKRSRGDATEKGSDGE